MCGKPGCFECNGKPGTVRKLGHRNAELTGYTDRDVSENTAGHAHAEHPLTAEGVSMFFDAMQAKYARLASDRLFDYTHPVDEYAPQGAPNTLANALVFQTISWQADYDMPERIEHISYSIPLGTTYCTLQLGQRLIVLYQGAALTTPIVGSIFTGIVINADDERVFTCTGATGTGYIGVAGWALTRGQFS